MLPILPRPELSFLAVQNVLQQPQNGGGGRGELIITKRSKTIYSTGTVLVVLLPSNRHGSYLAAKAAMAVMTAMVSFVWQYYHHQCHCGHHKSNSRIMYIHF